MRIHFVSHAPCPCRKWLDHLSFLFVAFSYYFRGYQGMYEIFYFFDGLTFILIIIFKVVGIGIAVQSWSNNVMISLNREQIPGSSALRLLFDTVYNTDISHCS